MKTSLKLRDDLWEAAKIRAAQERKDLADIVNEALENYFGVKRAEEMAFPERSDGKKGGRRNAG